MFEEQLEALNKEEPTIDECGRFGDEIANDLRKFTDHFKCVLVMRAMRECIFYNLYSPATVNPPTHFSTHAPGHFPSSTAIPSNYPARTSDSLASSLVASN